MCVLILGLVVAQIQVEAAYAACCRNFEARKSLNVCMSLAGGGLAALPTCIGNSKGKCIWQTGATCPPNFPSANTLENSEVINEYCKLGCVSSVCSSITTFQNSADVDEEVVKAVEHCNNACSELCTNIALVTAA